MEDFGWYFPYASKRMPVMAEQVVATSQPLAAQAGLRMLLNGGNAVDAAIATAVTLTVVEPTSNGIGSDAFAIVRYGNEQFGLNSSGKSPAAWDLGLFSEMETMPRYGWNTVTVPGAVSGWAEMSHRFGKLDFEALLEPAIEYARNGFIVSPVTAAAWNRAAEIYKDFTEFCEMFLPEGRAPGAGEKIAFPDMSKTLERIAETSGEAFYRGDLAEQIIAHSKSHGGLMTKDDFANHRPEWVDTISFTYRDLTLHEIPPNSQGIAALIALGILEHFDVGSYPLDSADSLHLQIEAMKLAFADVYRTVSDPNSMKVSYDELLAPEYLKQQAQRIDLKRANGGDYDIPRGGGTVYLAAADSAGMMVSFIQSNYMGFGSGIVIPSTGISLQNRGYGFTLEHGHPNQVAGNKRPFHTIIPGFVTRDGEPVMCFGVMGGSFQPQGHVQVMVRIADYRQNPQAASDAPRWRVQDDGTILIENGITSSVIDELTARGHQVNKGDFTSFGGAQIIYKLEDGYLAASDHRKDGQAVGY